MIHTIRDEMIKKIMIIGCSGSGKSTLAKELHSITGIKLIHLDQYYWKPNWEEPTKTEWEETVRELSTQKSWIMDGNYGGTMDIRINNADTIVYLDIPTWKCLWRISKRTFQYLGKERPDLANGCNERFDFNFFHYVATFNFTRRKALTQKVEKFRNSKQVLILRTDKDIRRFLENTDQRL